MKNRLFLSAIALFLFFAHNPSSSYGGAAASRIVVTFSSTGENIAALLVAGDQGFFSKHGLDVRLVRVSSGPVGLSALVSGDSHFYYGSSTGATLGAIAGGLDAVFVAGLISRLTGAFVVNPAITSPKDLKGKNIGVQSMSGGVWIHAQLALDYWGLDPKRDDIKFRVIGDTSVLAQAIRTKVIDGSYLPYTYASSLERQGFRVLADLATLGIPYLTGGILARRSFTNSSPETIENTLQALAEATAFILEPKNKTAVIRSLAKGLRLEPIESAQEGYERIKGIYDRRMYPHVEGIRNVIRLLCGVNEKICRLRAEDLVDDRFVTKLHKEGAFLTK